MIHSVHQDDKNQSWLTITAESYNEWLQLESLYHDMVYVDGSKSHIVTKFETARQISLRVDRARTRNEDMDYYAD